MRIAFENISGILLVAHFIAAVVLVGSSTHNSVTLFNLIFRKRPSGEWRREKLYNTIVFYSFISCFILGSILYPAFRVYVRADYFDQSLKWATGIFEIKEHWLSAALLMTIVSFVIRKNFNFRKDTGPLTLYAFCVFATWVIVLFSTISSVILVSMKSV